jgi:DNA replication protein DnaC
MTEEMDQLLRNLRLHRMREILDRERSRAEKSKVSYDEFLARLLREEYARQIESRLKYRIDQARIPETWPIETFPFDKQPGVSAAQIRQLAQLDFIARRQNIVLIGPTGVGKTGIATGLLLKALHNGHRAIFIKAQDLFDELYASVADRSSRKLLDRWARVDLLLIDEMGYLQLRPSRPTCSSTSTQLGPVSRPG